VEEDISTGEISNIGDEEFDNDDDVNIGSTNDNFINDSTIHDEQEEIDSQTAVDD